MREDIQLRFEQFQNWITQSYSYHELFLLGKGEGDCDICFRVTARKDPQKEKASYAVKYYPNKKVLVAWDMMRRREHCGTQNYTLGQKWGDLNPNPYTAYAAYFCFKGDGARWYDKAVVVGEFFFRDFFENPEKWLAFNSEDCTFPSELSSKEDKWLSDRERKIYSVSQRERDGRFHLAVLNAYEHQCAICRINIEEVLQAAHLHRYEVANTRLGADNPENGICLCANHHLMYDRKLIDIDVKNSTLHVLDERIRQMPWYSEFERIGSKLVERKRE